MKKEYDRYIYPSQNFVKHILLEHHYMDLMQTAIDLLRGEGTVRTPGSSIDSFSGSAAGTLQTTGFSKEPLGGAGTVQTPGLGGAGIVQTPGSSVDTFGGTGAGALQTAGSSINSIDISGAGTVETPGSSIDTIRGSRTEAIQTPWSWLYPSGGGGSGTTRTPWSSLETFARSGGGTIQTPRSSRKRSRSDSNTLVLGTPGSGVGGSRSTQTPGTSIDPFGGSGAGIIETLWSSIEPNCGSGPGTTETSSSSIGPIGGSGAATFQTPSSSAGAADRSGAGCLSSLEELNPISLIEMEVKSYQHGRVLYGTLCAYAFKRIAVVTVLELDDGLAVRLHIHYDRHSSAQIRRVYPMGGKVGIRDPYLMRLYDGQFYIVVVDPAKIHLLNDDEVHSEL